MRNGDSDGVVAIAIRTYGAARSSANPANAARNRCADKYCPLFLHAVADVIC